MNNKQRKTLQSIFKKPTPVSLEWRAIASLIKALGGEVKHGDGSKVRIDLKNISVNIHCPHPQKKVPRYGRWGWAKTTTCFYEINPLFLADFEP